MVIRLTLADNRTHPPRPAMRAFFLRPTSIESDPPRPTPARFTHDTIYAVKHAGQGPRSPAQTHRPAVRGPRAKARASRFARSGQRAKARESFGSPTNRGGSPAIRAPRGADHATRGRDWPASTRAMFFANIHQKNDMVLDPRLTILLNRVKSHTLGSPDGCRGQ